MEADGNLKFYYHFKFKNGKSFSIKIHLDKNTLQYVPAGAETYSEWARLDNHQCMNCPLSSDTHPYCPIALNLVQVIPQFSDDYSFEEAEIAVETEQRTYFARTSLQRGLGSMLGIYMVSSGCPVMAKLKPMVRFHLPFASVEETIFRSASTYLLGQYFRYKKGLEADWDFKGLMQTYEEVQKVNIGMAERLRGIGARDANINAIIVLDIFAKELPQNIEHSLKPLEYLFEEEKESLK